MNPTRSRRHATALGVLLVALLALPQVTGIPGVTPALDRVERLVYDLRMQAHPPARGATDSEVPIVIVDIDEASLEREGQWPWPRRRIAELVERLDAAGAGVITLDILFAEAERNPVETVREHLPQDAALQARLDRLAPELDGDHRLARALQGREVVLGYVFHAQQRSRSGALPEPLPLEEPLAVEELALPPASGYSAPLPVLRETAATAGFFSLIPDADGTLRRAPLLARIDGELYGSLATETVRQFLFLEEARLTTETIDRREHLEALHLDDHLTVPVDGRGRMLVPYRGPPGSFPYVSAWQVLEDDPAERIPPGAIVLVGTTAPGLFDLRATPMDAVFPGVEIHANLIAAMLDEAFLTEPAWAPGANLSMLLVAGGLLALVLPRLAPLRQLAASLAAGGVLLAFTAWLWSAHGLVLDLASPLLAVVLIAVFNLGWGFLFEARTRHRLKAMFGQYVPPALVEQMSEHPEAFDFEGRSRELSILFSDIRGFTGLSESLEADQLKRLLNRYFTPMTRVIFEHRGTIDKYVGDMVMAFWGAPVDDREHATHAVEAALEMQAETARLREAFTAQGLPDIHVGIGINSGVVNVGDMGSEYRRAYTVLGDAVNLASRLEGSSKYYGVGIVVGERTRELTGECFVWRELDRVRVKGRDRPVRVFEPVCRSPEHTPELQAELDSLAQALDAFRSADLDAAEKAFRRLTGAYPGVGLYRLYLDRIEHLRREPPPPDWDGSWTRESK
ncbi:CHASE2 domain-containing protein [Thioalkalivibrio halophilus]|uniref:Adenylate/guanylate cyclase domain-containing protein n=1 Tax=Thioalkalivibrio halophilus TaxID=252474 RepID=A0A1V2ZWN3_9GAMM|nr:adenylate/guanylate cyclase domain-containing protein [Thioalkalivibrio halophilus]OOC09538.1 adenylate/guanylate cyclase domain-containing protein [Thioalkalivibrio halophilus]